jgi:hypothetical protein
MASLRIFLSLTCVLLSACGSEAREPNLPANAKVFPNLPLPPSSQFVSRAGSEDALQIRLFSAKRPDDITLYYRDLLSKGNWRLVSDVKKSDGSVMLYAEQDGPPIWVRIWPTSDRVGTMVELSGAVVGGSADTVKVDRAASKSSPKPTK